MRLYWKYIPNIFIFSRLWWFRCYLLILFNVNYELRQDVKLSLEILIVTLFEKKTKFVMDMNI